MALRIVFAGTPKFAVPPLKALIQSSHDVCAVYTQPDRPKGRGRKLHASPVKKIALENYLPIYQPETLRDEREQEPLRALNADVMIVVAYGLILPQAALDIPKYGCINVHASLLPQWRGAAPIQRALLAGDHETGITIMQMADRLDAGDILLQVKTPINVDDDYLSLHDRLSQMGADALISTLNLLEQNSLHPIQQDNRTATYAKKITKSEGKINWQESAENISRKIRAFNPWPGAFCEYGQSAIKLWKAEVIDEKCPAPPGRIINISKNCINVATGSGVLSIQKIQLPGGKPLLVSDFLNARKDYFQFQNSMQ